MQPQLDRSTEKERLAALAADSWYARGILPHMVKYSARVFERYWHGTRCLELGPAEGLMTGSLSKAFPNLVCVDGAEQFCEDLRQRYPTVQVVCSLFEEFEPKESFDTIVLGHVLEHIDTTVPLLRRARQWLAPGGIVCAAVPNARSLHRQAGVIMGILKSEEQLSETDYLQGHRRVYTPERLRAEFIEAGYNIDVFGGYWLKPLTIGQIEASWTSEMIEAFMQLGERYPDIAGEIYVIAS